MSSIRHIVAFVLMLVVSLSAVRGAVEPAAEAGRLLFSGDFAREQSASEIAHEGRWAIEQLPGGSVTIHDGRMIIEDKSGCSVWFMQELRAPVVITYETTVSSKARVSDLNCFWMATDPKKPALPDPLTIGFGRSGKFEDYDSLRTYYVGCGGNTNTTTRFRRYNGDGTKPLLPEHDLSDAKFLLTPDRTYKITLIAADGRAQFIRDGEVITDFRDPEPLERGYFAFRTVLSRIEIRNFRVFEAKPHVAVASEKPLALKFSAEIQSINIAQPSGDRHMFRSYDPSEIRAANKGIVVVGFDARWGVRCVVKSAEGTDPLLKEGATFTFVVHSPTISFAGKESDAIGTVVNLELAGRQLGDGSVIFDRLQRQLRTN